MDFPDFLFCLFWIFPILHQCLFSPLHLISLKPSFSFWLVCGEVSMLISWLSVLARHGSFAWLWFSASEKLHHIIFYNELFRKSALILPVLCRQGAFWHCFEVPVPSTQNGLSVDWFFLFLIPPLCLSFTSLFYAVSLHAWKFNYASKENSVRENPKVDLKRSASGHAHRLSAGHGGRAWVCHFLFCANVMRCRTLYCFILLLDVVPSCSFKNIPSRLPRISVLLCGMELSAYGVRIFSGFAHNCLVKVLSRSHWSLKASYSVSVSITAVEMPRWHLSTLSLGLSPSELASSIRFSLGISSSEESMCPEFHVNHTRGVNAEEPALSLSLCASSISVEEMFRWATSQPLGTLFPVFARAGFSLTRERSGPPLWLFSCWTQNLTFYSSEVHRVHTWLDFSITFLCH